MSPTRITSQARDQCRVSQIYRRFSRWVWTNRNASLSTRCLPTKFLKILAPSSKAYLVIYLTKFQALAPTYSNSGVSSSNLRCADSIPLLRLCLIRSSVSTVMILFPLFARSTSVNFRSCRSAWFTRKSLATSRHSLR